MEGFVENVEHSLRNIGRDTYVEKKGEAISGK